MSFFTGLARLVAPALLAVASPSGACTTPFGLPAAGSIVDPFRPPACRWCPGNRGIDYATTPGDPVRAAAAGVVAFAGAVAGRLVIVVNHDGGLRTTYDDVAAVVVAPGTTVRAGDIIGWAGSHLHFGVRRGDVYLDPAPFLAPSCPRARLVPLQGPGPP